MGSVPFMVESFVRCGWSGKLGTLLMVYMYLFGWCLRFKNSKAFRSLVVCDISVVRVCSIFLRSILKYWTLGILVCWILMYWFLVLFVVLFFINGLFCCLKTRNVLLYCLLILSVRCRFFMLVRFIWSMLKDRFCSSEFGRCQRIRFLVAEYISFLIMICNWGVFLCRVVMCGLTCYVVFWKLVGPVGKKRLWMVAWIFLFLMVGGLRVIMDKMVGLLEMMWESVLVQSKIWSMLSFCFSFWRSRWFFCFMRMVVVEMV